MYVSYLRHPLFHVKPRRLVTHWRLFTEHMWIVHTLSVESVIKLEMCWISIFKHQPERGENLEENDCTCLTTVFYNNVNESQSNFTGNSNYTGLRKTAAIDRSVWQRDWPRDQCVTVAQVCTGHSPLVAAYLHRIEHQDSAICPHCHSADETAEHLVFQCPAHDHARRDTWPGDTFTADPRCLWSYLEWIGAVTRPPTGNEREREREERSVNIEKRLS